jgi:hypothetical protein
MDPHVAREAPGISSAEIVRPTSKGELIVITLGLAAGTIGLIVLTLLVVGASAGAAGGCGGG